MIRRIKLILWEQSFGWENRTTVGVRLARVGRRNLRLGE